MELFSAAGVDLPSSGGSARRGRGVARTLRVPLFNYKVVQRARELAAFAPTAEQRAAAENYARQVRSPKFLKQKETAVRGVFIQTVLQTLLGYAPVDPEQPFTLAIEKSIRGGAVDVALGRFNPAEGAEELVAPFELKGPDTGDLDRVMPGRGRSPVQQAWDYAIDSPGSRWVLVSNCLEIRLYGFGRGRDAFELFDLSRLDEEEEHARLWLVLSQDRLLGGATDRLLRDTDSAYKDITNTLYSQYSALRKRLIQFLTDSVEGPKLTPLPAIETAQKILDRILFIAFAQRTDLLPDALLEQAAREQNKFVPQPIWQNFLALFRAVDAGNNRLSISAYNGGLFAVDPVADTLILPDDLAGDVAALGQWDYRREVPVTVLGHIFEQSITDIERDKAISRGEEPPPESKGKRKREGVVYTPEIVTRFLVERTIGLSLDERRAALWAQHGLAEESAATTSADSEIAFWQDYLATLRDITIVDPACGSGAFLVAAFDELARRYRDAVTGLQLHGVEIDFDVFDEIVTRNLYGVDLNPESVEITRLSLWLKTARRERRLQNLEATIRVGNSLIDDRSVSDRAFNWRAEFPEVFARGGFNIVVGNPPYVRMEFLKPIKPFLEDRFVVAADRADLYAYFFEQGARLLKPGGRLGYISSSTFFRTGSGENLRRFLTDGLSIETVVDFGDLQIFEGFTTYPAIVTLQQGGVSGEGALRFLNVKDSLPNDLGRAFAANSAAMPRARLGAGSWRFEQDALARLRDKIAAGRKTLGEVYGPPLYGIKTGLNKAFVIDRATRDLLAARDANSTELLKPFLRGENVRRWRVESEDLFLINTPKGKVDIEAYPAVRDWLLPFKQELEKRATKQEWWELQQAQLAYQSHFANESIVFPDISEGLRFSSSREGAFLDCTLFFIPRGGPDLLSVLNSSVALFFFRGLTPEVQGGFIRFKSQFVEAFPIAVPAGDAAGRLAWLSETCTVAARSRFAIEAGVRHRILTDLVPVGRKLTGSLESWEDLDFTGFREELTKAYRVDIPLKQRAEWEVYLAEHGAEVRKLGAEIATAEREIDAAVYGLFDLTDDEIRLIEESLAAA